MRLRARAALLLACAGTLWAGATPAQGARPHEFKTTFATPGSGPGQLKEPDGVAVSEATGEVYVVDKGNNRVERFSAKGAFIGEFAGTSATGSGTLSSGSKTITAAIATEGAFNVGQEIKATGLPAGTTITALGPPGSLELEVSQAASASEMGAALSAHQSYEAAEGIAVDNSCAQRKLSGAQCTAEDPSNGDVYVVDAGNEHLQEHRALDKYSPTGEYLGQISAGAEGRFGRTLDGVAVNRSGEVFIYQETRAINRYSNAAQNKFESGVEASKLEAGHPGFAIDRKGIFYASQGPSGVKASTVASVSPTGEVLNAEFDPGNASAVTVDPSTNHVLVDDLSSIAVRDSEANLFERLGEEKGVKHLQQGAGLAINGGEGLPEGAGNIYVADAATGQVIVFIPAEASTPKVESVSFAEVSSNSALLQAQINPRSEAGEAPTEYRFQYGRCASGESCAASGYEASTPSATIPAGFENQAVSAKIAGLAPDATYHFRVLLKNTHSKGQEAGPEDTFMTQSQGGELVLPDNRGYELVSPPDKHGALIEPISQNGVTQAAADGSAITYLANAPTEAGPQGFSNVMQILSRRGAAAWSSLDVGIPHGAVATGASELRGSEYKFFNAQLDLSAVQPFGEYFPLSEEESSEPTAYLHNLNEGCESHCYRPLVTSKGPAANVAEGVRFGEEESCPHFPHLAEIQCGPKFIGASEDLAHVVLRASVGLLSGAEAGLYEWNGGPLAAVSVLPGGGGEAGAQLGAGGVAVPGAIASDGSLVVWSQPNAAGLFDRDTARGETVQLDAAQASCKPEAKCESGGGVFQFACPNGSRVFFTSTHKLSEDSGAEAKAGKADLYECKVAVIAGKLGCALTDLTPLIGKESAEVQGALLGASEEGAYLYLVARGALTEETSSRGTKAIKGQPNLYELHEGQARFIATLSEGDEFDGGAPESQPTRVTSSGQWLSLMSQASLTGYDNRDIATGKPVAEVYLFNAQENKLTCASCDPSGARPVGVEAVKLNPASGGLTGGPREIWPETSLVGANVPGWTVMAAGLSRYQPRYLTDEGRLFFDSINPLVSQDSNGTQDVYEYEPAGVGNCTAAAETYVPAESGCVSLISSGSSNQESAFIDASESGDDVFFLTAAKLSPLDTDNAFDIYDAHVCTSEAPCITFPVTQVPPCTTEASCKAAPTPQPAIFGAPSSETFQGAGNLAVQTPTTPAKKSPAEIRKEALAKALKACKKLKNKRKRRSCKAQARKRYGSSAKAKKQSKPKRRRS